jgi:hypothetical protein
MKSSGKAPPKFAFKILKIAARFLGDMCFAASILKPENPRLIMEVK